MQEGPSWEANSYSTSNKILCIFWTSKIHYRVHNSLPLDPTLSQINPVNALPTHIRDILIISYYLGLGFPSGLLPSGFPTKTLCIFVLPHTCHMPRPWYPHWFYEPNCIWWGVQTIKLTIMHFSPAICYRHPLSTKYLPQHPNSI